MIKFFRKIRQNLLIQGKTGKYFKYAIGEIVLVVIGILIALQINNRNEDRKSIKKTVHLLTQIHKELAFNIHKANDVFSNYRSKDSIVYKVLNKKVTFNDYKTNPRLSRILLGIPTADLKDNAFKILMNHDVSFTVQQDTIISKLIDLYETDKIRVDLADELAIQRLQKNADKIRSEKTWYYNYHVKNENTDEMINYYLNDPMYLNEITHYGRTNLNGHNRRTLFFRNNAMESYKELSNYLNIKQDTAIIKDLNHYSHYLGTYDDNPYTIDLKKDKGNILYIRTNSKGETEFETVVYPETKTYFMVGNVFGKLLYNNDNEVTGFVRSLGSYKKEYKKIK